MRLLLDTHVLVWTILGLPQLSTAAREAIRDPENTVYVSMISAWEIGIKKAIGKLHLPDDLEEAIEQSGYQVLTPGFGDVRAMERLPLIHRDPFDRLLVAQALEAGLQLVTSDRQVTRYDVPVFW